MVYEILNAYLFAILFFSEMKTNLSLSDVQDMLFWYNSVKNGDENFFKFYTGTISIVIKNRKDNFFMLLRFERMEYKI